MRKILCFFIFILIFSVPSLLSQQVEITGKVVGEDGTGMPGVNVVIKGTTTGTVTDVEGNYIITVPDAESILQFSYIGYLSEEITVGNQTTIDISLVPDIARLEEVVVVGYGTIPRSDITGAVSSVRAEDLPVSTAVSIDNLLQGKAAGLNLRVFSAQPGGKVDVNIRGAISPNGDNAPLYVIDGIPITDNDRIEWGIHDDDLGYYGGIERSPLNTINPADIESIDILKDASATAIYGSSAANGVILITTKKGKAGKARVEYRGSYTIQKPKDYFDYLNATEFMEQHNRLSLEKHLFDYRIDPYGTTPADVFTPRFTQEEIDTIGEGTDWLDFLLRDGSIQEHNISVSGGSESTVVYASFNYYDNQAILKNSDFIRYSGRINLDQKVSERINFKLNLNLSQINSDNVSTGSNSGGLEKYNMLQAAYSFAPTVDVFDEEGNYTYSYDRQIMNPAAFLIVKDKIRTTRLDIIPSIEVKIIEDLSLNLIGGLDRQTSNRNFYLPVKAQRYNLPDGMAQLANNRTDNLSSEAYLTYNKAFANSNITVVAGAGYYKTLNDGFFLVGRDFFTDAFEENNVQIASNKETSRLDSHKSERTKISQFFRINYSLKDKYIISLVGRRDGSSIFAEDKKYGFFPGISGAWKVSHEEFMSNVPVISNLKIRAGYGSSGNESVLVGNSLQLYSAGLSYLIGSTYYNGVTLAQVENKELSWETDYTLNLGMDLGLFQNRFNASFEYYEKTAKDLLDFNQLPRNNAVGLVAANVGSTKAVGYELTLATTNIVGSEFKWTTDFNISTYKAYWIERNPEVELAEYIEEDDEIRAIYGWETNGIIKSEEDRPHYMPNAFVGNVIYVDQNNDSTLNIEDVVKLGNLDPKWSFGLGNTFTFKGFDLNIYFYGILKKKALFGYAPGGASAYTGSTAYGISQNNPNNVLTTVKDVWSTDNPDGIYPGVASNPYSGNNPASNNHLDTDYDIFSGDYYAISSDYYLRDASFVRLKNISLGYTIPTQKFIKQVASARIYVNLENVAVFTEYEGFDPEYADANPYPQAMSTTFGIDVTF
ncbi:MAG: TonB-dependent receptor [Bacteroidales bacterium]|nr:MAG: TonB-dependent receptor [Bacteroidales bacterium]